MAQGLLLRRTEQLRCETQTARFGAHGHATKVGRPFPENQGSCPDAPVVDHRRPDRSFSHSVANGCSVWRRRRVAGCGVEVPEFCERSVQDSCDRHRIVIGSTADRCHAVTVGAQLLPVRRTMGGPVVEVRGVVTAVVRRHHDDEDDLVVVDGSTRDGTAATIATAVRCQEQRFGSEVLLG